MNPETLQTDFWQKVDVGEEDECWEWTGATTGGGYGNLRVGSSNKRAHRVAYGLEVEPPGEELVLHHCDNPVCVNPAHLYLGDCSDNAKDAVERGQIDESTLFQSSLTDEEVEEIRRSDKSAPELADEYDVSRSHIWNVWSGHRG